MENVVAFNNELSGLYESKPPISKAKMAAITRAAMRAIKFYKHVVQSVEKFILKCKPEYKVPGLYVIDSIVRQSRHQYGPEKDVFAPRFARNMTDTFANLFRCAPEDKSRIIRVLNLWQKNNVFTSDVIQPIFDLADPNHPIYSMPPPVASTTSSGPSGSANVSSADLSTSQANGLNTSGGSLDISMGGGSGGGGGGPQSGQDDKLPQSSLADLSSVSPHERSRNTNNTLRQLEHKQHSKRSSNTASNMASTSSSKSREHSKSTLESVKIHHPETYSKYQRSSHDYEYDDGGHHVADNDGSSDECGASPKNSNNLLDNNNLKQLLNDPNVLRQLQTLQNFTKFKQDDKQHNLRLQEEAFEKHLQNVLKTSASGSGNQDVGNDFNKEVEFVSEEQKIEVINLDGNDSRSPTPDRDRYKRRRSRSRSRSRERINRNRRGRSRSRSRSRSPRSNRRRNSRDRERTNRDKEKDREHERERRKKGLPDIKKDHLSVCSTTLWVGHLSKLVYQEELSDTFGEYGDIVSIDQIVPRGCAFIVMNRRQDAYKAMQGLKNHKLQGRVITISWAAGKGVKSKEWKDFWDLELGVTYIPWKNLDESTDFDTLEEGGMFDEDSMPNWMKEKINKLKSLKEIANEHANLTAGPPPALPPGGNPGMMFGIDTTQPPPGPPPTSGPPPMMPMVPGQFSMAPPMGGPPRMLGGPHMSMPISGIHMPSNIVPSHAMMMMPGYGMSGPSGAPSMGGPHHIPTIGGHPAQYPPPASASMASNANLSSDDQMDIEMEDEEGAVPTAPPANSGNGLNFNQPPPAFAGGNNDSSAAVEVFTRDRNRGGGSRWGGRGAGPEEENNEGRWRENGGPGGPQGGPHNFPEGGGPRNPGGPPHRPEFMNDYEKRGGPRGGPNYNGGGGGDFHPNMQNRFNQPTNLMQMRIPPPNAFNQRGGPGGGGPPMFMRGGPGGPGGGRQQGPGFFNRNNPFDRDNSGGGGGGFGERGRGGRGGRGGGRGGRGGFGGGRDGGSHNWSDEEGDDGGFKRRGPGGNRFRDREGSADRFNMRDSRGGRRGPGGPPRERIDSERDWERDNRAGRGPSAGGSNRRISRDDSFKKKPRISDTEEDWDRELKDYDTKNEKKPQTQTTSSFKSNPTKTSESSNKSTQGSDNKKSTNEADKPKATSAQQNVTKPDGKPAVVETKAAATKETESKQATPAAAATATATKDDSNKNNKSASTPLYDEIPTPKSINTTPATKPPAATAVINKPPVAAATPSKPAETVKPAETAKPAETVKPAVTATVKPAETVKPTVTAAAPAEKPTPAVTAAPTATAAAAKPPPAEKPAPVVKAPAPAAAPVEVKKDTPAKAENVTSNKTNESSTQNTGSGGGGAEKPPAKQPDTATTPAAAAAATTEA